MLHDLLTWRLALLLGAALALAGCGCGDDEKKGECDEAVDCEGNLACIDHECVPCTANEDCGEDGVCDLGPEGEPGCYEPVVVRGMVFDLSDDSPIEGARVVALDANNAPASSVAVTDENGNYELGLPSLRGEEGAPVGANITLRADAAGYQTFPSGVRQALPIDTVAAAEVEGDWVVESAQTDIGLIPLEEGSGTGSIFGTVALSEEAAYGVLVVAELGGEGTSAIADLDGGYRIFNLPAGDYTVTAYTRGVSYESVDATLPEGGEVEVNLALSGEATSTVTGSVQIVNPGDGQDTSIILVVESTFDENLVRGDAPPGLRAPDPGIPPDVDGAFTIEGVPAGRYVILAAFENDFLVRDPDSCIAGTDIVHQTVTAGQDVTIDESFKITGALNVISPGATGPEAVTGNPTLSWEDDSSEDEYRVIVLDSLGNVVWETTIPGESGDDPAVEYGGDPLEEGMYYQFRATSVRTGREDCEISQTEDLKGVFYLAPPES